MTACRLAVTLQEVGGGGWDYKVRPYSCDTLAKLKEDSQAGKI